MDGMDTVEALRVARTSPFWAEFDRYFNYRKKLLIEKLLVEKGEERTETIGRFKEINDFYQWMEDVLKSEERKNQPTSPDEYLSGIGIIGD